MGSAADWLREERRKTLGDWVAICRGCGHAQRYFTETETEVEPACPTCGDTMLSRCPSCGAQISSMFAVACEECEAGLRPAEQFGTAIRRVKPGRRS
jgi:ribosomal protein S27E